MTARFQAHNRAHLVYLAIRSGELPVAATGSDTPWTSGPPAARSRRAGILPLPVRRRYPPHPRRGPGQAVRRQDVSDCGWLSAVDSSRLSPRSVAKRASAGTVTVRPVRAASEVAAPGRVAPPPVTSSRRGRRLPQGAMRRTVSAIAGIRSRPRASTRSAAATARSAI